MSFFSYTANIWIEDECKEEVVHGLTFGNCWSEAMNNIEAYYAGDLISVELMETDSDDIYEFELNEKMMKTPVS